MPDLVRRDPDCVNRVLTRHPVELRPIQLAFTCHDRTVIQFLLEHGATPFPYANQELLNAARAKNWEVVYDFFKWKSLQAVPADIPEELLGQLLHVAVAQNAPAEVKQLLQLGAKIDYIHEAQTPIERAVEEGYWDVVTEFAPHETTATDSARYGYALLRLIQVNKIQAAIDFLGKKASTTFTVRARADEIVINPQGKNTARAVPAGEVGYTPLHYAVLKSDSHPQLLTALLASNPDLNAAAQGVTPLQLALTEGKASAVRLLMTHIPPVIVRDQDFVTLVTMAHKGSLEDWATIAAFISNGDNLPDTKYQFYHQLLKLAIAQDKLDIVNLIKTRLVNQLPGTPDSLHIVYAAKLKRWDAVSELSNKEPADKHLAKRDFLLAAFLAVVEQKNDLAFHLLSISAEPQGTLQAEDLAATGFLPTQVGYNAVMFAFAENNQAFAEKHMRTHAFAKSVTVDGLGKTYMQTAMDAKNKTAVRGLSLQGIQVDAQALTTAITRQNWDCVTEYLEHATRLRTFNNVALAELLPEVAANDAQRTFVLRMIARETVQNQSREMQRDTLILVGTIGTLYLTGYLNEKAALLLLCLTLLQLANHYPVVETVQHYAHLARTQVFTVETMQNCAEQLKERVPSRESMQLFATHMKDKVPSMVVVKQRAGQVREQLPSLEAVKQQMPSLESVKQRADQFRGHLPSFETMQQGASQVVVKAQGMMFWKKAVGVENAVVAENAAAPAAEMK